MNIEDHPRYKEYREREHELYVNYAKAIRQKKDLPYQEFQAFCSEQWKVYHEKLAEVKKELGIEIPKAEGVGINR